MKQRYLIFFFWAALLIVGCTEKKSIHVKSTELEASRIRMDSMPESVKLDSDLLSDSVPLFLISLEV